MTEIERGPHAATAFVLPGALVILLLVREAVDNVATSTSLDDTKTVVDIIGAAVTAIAVIVGGVWAYFRFIKDRTYRPRLEVTMGGQWAEVATSRLLHARVRVKNIGASVVNLQQAGTGLRISKVASAAAASSAVAWEKIAVFAILAEHEWIEPGETVSDDLLLRLEVPEDAPVLFETRLVWTWSRQEGNIVVFARQVIHPDAVLEGTPASGEASE